MTILKAAKLTMIMFLEMLVIIACFGLFIGSIIFMFAPDLPDITFMDYWGGGSGLFCLLIVLYILLESVISCLIDFVKATIKLFKKLLTLYS
jgi:hypothetical protein